MIRNSSVRQLAIATLLCLGLCSAAAFGKSIEERKWIRMESQNFTIYSVRGESRTRSMLKHLEAVRSLFLGGKENGPTSMVPTVIYALGGNKDFRELGLEPDKYAGLFMPRLRENIVIVRKASGMEEAETIIHEYIHFLQYNNLRFPFPKWYLEGYAEYVSTSAIDGGRLAIGGVDESRTYWLAHHDWLPMETIIDSAYFATLEDDKSVYKFYSQSWLLTHYLYNQEGGEPYVIQSLIRYAHALESGANEIDAFEKGFGIELPELEEELKKYRRKGKYNYFLYPIEPLIGDFEPVSTRLTQEEISVELAGLILRLHFETREPDADVLAKARQLYEIGLTNHATQARAEIGIGFLLEVDGNAKAAEEYISSGASLATDDLYVQLDATQFWLNRLGNGEYDDRELVANADPYLRRVLAIDRNNPEALYTAGVYLVADGDFENGIQAMMVAAARAPGVQYLLLNLAILYMEDGQPGEALVYANDLLLLSHGNPARADAARKLVEQIEEAHESEPDASN